jgi:hypothetical protein
MARGTPPGEQPYCVQNKDREIANLKRDRTILQKILNELFDTDRDWLEATMAEILELKERIE